MVNSQLNTNKLENAIDTTTPGGDEEMDETPTVTPEKALQFNVVLNEINRKWVAANWSAA